MRRIGRFLKFEPNVRPKDELPPKRPSILNYLDNTKENFRPH